MKDVIMVKSGQTVPYFFLYFLVLLFYSSMKLYLLWGVNELYISIPAFLFGFSYFSQTRTWLRVNKWYFIACVLFYLATIREYYGSSPLYYFVAIVKPICIYFVLILPLKVKTELLRLITISFAIILGISLVFYLLVTFGFTIPSYGQISFNDGQYSFVNYGLYIQSMNIVDFYRFNSVFLEPGHVAMISAFILYAQDFRIKDNIFLVLILICALVTLSLAGYVLILGGFVLFQFANQKSAAKYRRLSLFFLSVLLLTNFAIEYNNGDNLINEKIVERLNIDETTGLLTGWNRTSDVADIYFSNAISKGDIWSGIGVDKYNVILKTTYAFNAAGYKPYLLTYGIVGTLLMFFFYFCIAKGGLSKKKMYLMLLLYMFCFMQRSYPDWWAWILPFICSVDEKNRHNNPQTI